MLYTGLWLIAVASACVWLLFALDNGETAWRYFRGEDNGRPFSPFLGGGAGILAVIAVPIGDLAVRLPWALIPLVLDFGSIPYIWLSLFGETIEKARLRSFALRADVAAQNRFGATPLHCAAVLNMASRCQELIELGADVRVQDRWGMTPLDRATISLSDDAARVIAAATGVEYQPLPRAKCEQ